MSSSAQCQAARLPFRNHKIVESQSLDSRRKGWSRGAPLVGEDRVVQRALMRCSHGCWELAPSQQGLHHP